MKSKNGELLTQPERITERWIEYFSELLNVQGSEDECRDVEILKDGTDNTEDILITMDEVKSAVSQMKIG